MKEVQIQKKYILCGNEFHLTSDGFYDAVELYYYTHKLGENAHEDMIIEVYRKPYYHSEKILSLAHFSSLILEASASRTELIFEDYTSAYPRPMWKHLYPLYRDEIVTQGEKHITIHAVDPENIKIWILGEYDGIYTRIELTIGIYYYTGNDKEVVLDDAYQDLMTQMHNFFEKYNQASVDISLV